MKNFIEVISNGDRVLINTRHIKVVESSGSEGVIIYLLGNAHHNFYTSHEDYNEVVRKIEEATE